MFDGLIADLNSWFRNRQLKRNGSDIDNDIPSSYRGIKSVKQSKTHGAHTTNDITNVANQLSICAQNLKNSCKSVESSFLTLGQDLQFVHSDAAELNQRTLNAIQGVGGGSDDRVLNRVVALAKTTLTELTADCAALKENIGQSDKIIQHLHTLFGLSKSIKGTSRSLKMIALNINIESARLDEEKEVFISLAQEIKRLSEAVAELSVSMGEDAQEAQASLIAAQSNFGQNIDQLGMTAHSVENSLSDAVPAVEKIMELSLEIFSRAGGNAQEISNRVGEIVVGIQIHDSISQRVEHIATSLEEAKALCNAGATNDSDEKIGTVHSIARLQTAQLNNIVSEIQDVYQKSIEAFHFIEITIEDMTGNLSGLDSDDGKYEDLSTDDDQSPIGSLKSVLEHTTGLIGQATEKTSQLNNATEDSMESVNRLTGLMGSILNINSEIHLGALNAIVNSTRLGIKGAAIAVLVQDMSDMAAQSNEFATAVGDEIKEITGTTETMKSRIQDSQNEDNASQLQAGLDEFTENCDAFHNESCTITEQGGILRKNISSVKTSLEFLNDFSAELKQQLGRLNEIVAALSPWAENYDNNLAVNENKMHERYTMETERGIHQTFVNRPEDSAVATDSDTYNGNDVKLFEDANELSTPEKREKEAADNELGENIELF